MIVADTNLIAYLLLPGDRTSAAEAVLRRDPLWSAPPLWRSELRSVLALYLRKGLLDRAGADAVFAQAERVIGDREQPVGTDAVLDLVTTTALSAYDAEFVALAVRLDVSLVSADARLLAAAPGRAVSPEAFAAG